MRQITRISPCILTGEYDAQNNPLYGYNEEIIVGADATRFRNGEGENAVCMGKNTTATKGCSFAAGEDSYAIGYCSFALGKNTTANDECSFALGKNTTAITKCSFAAGENSNAIGYCSFALGYNVETPNNYSFACGHYNNPLDGAIFMVGCGSASKKNNAITVYDKCTVNDISYSIGDTVINGVTAYASGKVEMPGITANVDGTVSIPKLNQLSNYATKSEVNTITEAHNNLSQQYTGYVNSNNQVVSKICTTGNGNNGAIKKYAKGMHDADGDSFDSMIHIIAGLFKAIGDGIRSGYGIHEQWTDHLRNTLDNGAQNLENELKKYLRDIDNTIVTLTGDLKDF